MRILHVNKFLYRRGGAEAYLLDLAALQAAAGHEVAFFAMQHPENEPSRYAASFPARVDFEPPPPSLGGKMRGVGRLLWSSTARRGMEEVVRAFRPDLVHLHNIYHQLSPSILGPLRHRAIPSVMTLHDYKLACPTYRFLDHGEICEACVPRRFHQAVLHRCNGGSLGASAVNAIEMTLHTLGNAYGTVRAFLCPSRFLMEKMQAARVFPERLRWVPNFVDVSSIEVKSLPGGGAAYAGRLSPEKGIDVLIDAVGRIGAELDIAGDGPDRGALERLAATKAPGRVRFHGRLTADGVHALFREAAAVVLPSRWHENQPLAVLESFACGVPVIGTALGGIPELIEPGRTGDIVPPNDAEALGASLARLLGDPPSALRMGQAARSRAERDFTPGVHLARVEQVYAEVMEGTPS